MNIFYKEVLVELRKITTIDLASKSANLLEKLLWTLIGITGTIWAAYFITLQVSIIAYFLSKAKIISKLISIISKYSMDLIFTNFLF